MNTLEAAKDFAKRNGFYSIKTFGEWRGQMLYSFLRKKEDMGKYLGRPSLIVINKNGGAYLTDGGNFLDIVKETELDDDSETYVIAS